MKGVPPRPPNGLPLGGHGLTWLGRDNDCRQPLERLDPPVHDVAQPAGSLRWVVGCCFQVPVTYDSDEQKL